MLVLPHFRHRAWRISGSELPQSTNPQLGQRFTNHLKSCPGTWRLLLVSGRKWNWTWA